MPKRSALTWDELADAYDQSQRGSRPARTLPMEAVFEWAEKQTDCFILDEQEGTLHHIQPEALD